MKDYRVATFRKFAAEVVEWNPAEHGGEREPWESMEATMEAGWPARLAANQCQKTADPPVTERDTNLTNGRRRVLRFAWVLPLDVPPDLAARCCERVLHGVLRYEP